MAKSMAESRKVNGKTEYLCPYCQEWVKAQQDDSSGYTDLVCEGCGQTLVKDWYGHFETEKYGPECNFCGRRPAKEWTRSIPPHDSVYCCDECYPHEKSRLE